MAKERSGMVFERVYWYGAVEYTDESGKRQRIERKAKSKKHALEVASRLAEELKKKPGKPTKIKASTFSKSAGWYARVTITDEAGKRRDIWKKGENKTDAKELLKNLIRDLDDSGETVVEGNKTTLSEYFDHWLSAAAKPRVSERTYADYEDLLRRYIRPALGRKKLSEVRPLDVQRLYSSMQERGLSARTIRYTHAVLTSGFKQAMKWGLMPRNPAQLAELPRQARQEMHALSPDMAARFLAAAATDKWGVLFALALATGMRPEEYLGLQWRDVDIERAIVTVQRTLVWRRRGGGYYFGEPKTSRSRRSIPIPSSVARSLVEHRRKQNVERLKAGPGYENLDLVFATPQGGPLMLQNLMRRHFKPILLRAELPESIRMYDLRHSCATLLLAAQENPKVVSERLGHASITLTLDTYSHVLPSMQQAATEKLEQMLFRPKAKRGRK